MEPVENTRRTPGNSWIRVTFRRNLLVFLIFFGLANVILVLLYSQVFGGELFGQQNPTANRTQETIQISKITYKNRIFPTNDKIAATEANDAELDGTKNLAKPTTSASTSEKTTSVLSNAVTSSSIASKENQPSDVYSSKEEITNDVKPSHAATERRYLNDVLLSTKGNQNRTETSEVEKLNNTKATASNTTTTALQVGKKLTTSKPTTEGRTSISTTPFQRGAIEDAFCKPYKLSEKTIAYTTKKYAIVPEIRTCKDQKSPPNELCKVNETKSSNGSYTNLEIKCDFSVCDKTKRLLVEYMNHEDGLMKIYEIPKNLNNSEIELLIQKFADDVRKHDLPFLFVNCTAVDATVVAQILTFLPPQPPVKDDAIRDKININILLVDSVSRPHFYRSFPDTIRHLKDIEADSQYPAHVFNFELFQAVHGHTNENERALFGGTLFPILRGSKARDKTPVNLDPLYGVFKNAGFQTMFLDDLCWRGHWGIMDKYKVGSWKSLLGKLQVSNIDTRGKFDGQKYKHSLLI